MIDVASYWTLPPSDQGSVRDDVKEYGQELQRAVGYYKIWMETSEHIEFSLLCGRCFNVPNRALYTPITKEEYLDKNHDMYGEKCDRCKKTLA